MATSYRSRLSEIASSGFRSPAPIGAGLEEVRARLLLMTGELERHLGEHALPVLGEARSTLESHACRIAVVGQVKSGKTTLINALINSPNLLPTDINPWTAVVTSLHFRNDGPAPQHAAAFHFFSLEEWRDLAEGGGKLSELTKRLVPEYRPELLRAQLEVMYARAGSRLGPSMQELLGKSHLYQEITPELLSDYISAGDETGGSSDRTIYSDIVRSAELFFGQGPFAFPVILIDTPGTNDPFLLRDEVTRRSLENPDIYVFTMSALQPLLPADISMLRLLNGLHKDRIIMFVNRIDQLPDPAVNAAKIRTVVEEQLRMEFPSLQIPVIVGSAWLGQYCHDSQLSQLPPQLTAGIGAALRDAGVGSAEAADGLDHFEKSQLASILQSLSGMNAMAAALTKSLSVSNSSALLQQIANTYFELARYAEISTRAELRSADTPQDAGEAATQGAQFRGRASALRDSFTQIETNLRALVAARMTAIDASLRHIVRGFADEQAAAVQQAMQLPHREKVWVCDVTPLREALEAAYVASFQEAVASLKGIEQGLYPHLETVVTSLLPDYRGEPIEAPPEPMQFYPSAAPLSNFVTMDLSQSWWKMWSAARPDPQERADHLRRLIDDDFLALVDKLAAELATQLGQRVDHTMKKMQAVGNSLLAAIDARTHSTGTDRGISDRTPSERQEQIAIDTRRRRADCAKRLSIFVAVGNELRELLKRLDLMWIENGGI